MKRMFGFAGLLVIASSLSVAWPTHAGETVPGPVDRSPAAISRWRAQGPEGLEVLFSERTKLTDQRNKTRLLPDEHARLDRAIRDLDEVIDQVGGARYCSVSRLFWHTDLPEAQAASARSGKPILSLRMLGNLTDELSCANSRFFRSTLYSNQEISDYLRQHFILHWQSVRPVPVITIDFGDGRRIQRTITGNSAHYVLTPEGQPLDVLPGLYGPLAFLEWLHRSEELARNFAAVEVPQRADFLKAWHASRYQAVADAWRADLLKAAPESVTLLEEVQPSQSIRIQPQQVGKSTAVSARHIADSNVINASQQAAPIARAAAALARPKGRVKAPILQALALDVPRLEKSLDDAAWNRIAALHANEATLDRGARAVIARENPNALAAGRVAVTKSIVENPLAKMVRNLESTISLDTVRNEYLLHLRIHEWFATGNIFTKVQPLNERVYSELFLTPSSDPWLGLVPPNTYTALERGGLVQETPAPR